MLAKYFIIALEFKKMLIRFNSIFDEERAG